MNMTVFVFWGRVGALPVRLTPLRNCARTTCHGTRTTIFNNISICRAPFMQVSQKRFHRGSMQSVLPRGGQIPRLVPRLVTSRVSGARQVVTLFVRRNCQRVSVGLNYPFPVLTGQRYKSNVLPRPSGIRALLGRVRRCPNIDFSMGVHLK